MRILVVLGLLLLAACAAEQQPGPIEEPEEPELPPVQPDSPDEEPEPQEGNGSTTETINETEPEQPEEYAIPDNPLTGVSCDGDALTFTITNTVESTWSLEPFGFSETDKERLKVSINSYDPWNPDRYFTEQSLRDCTEPLISPGDTFTCTVEPIPIIQENDYSSNHILVQALKVYEKVEFTCS